MVKYEIVAQTVEQTVVAEYVSPYSRERSYQSEAELETELIRLLERQAYEYLPITSEPDLIKNLRLQIERLNGCTFTDSEWERLFNEKIANQNNGIAEKTRIIQEDHVHTLTLDSGEFVNIKLIDKENIHNNSLQVINQYEVDTGQRPNRYDVTILVNGLPLVHIELKRRGVEIQEAFNQINRYARESFWAGSGLFEYVQIFVISNGTHTKYYSNTTRNNHIKEYGKTVVKKGKRTSNSFEFTSWWADANNKAIPDLMDFASTFFAKHTILNILTKYSVFTTEDHLLVMRPYQIAATERILERINIAHHNKRLGTIDAGGYVWHTTGSGKTLTSFKTAQIASKLNYIDKVLFVVDRKDLDYQTMKEYDKFQKGAANSNTSTRILKKQLEDNSARIIITTIQKLSRFIRGEKTHQAFNQRTIIIFDECHRSQFGEMHTAIKKTFKNYYLFGFTGTPIFASNAPSTNRLNIKTTEQAFGTKLHTYTIVDAINDRNVLPFKIDYVSTMREEEQIDDEKVWDIDREAALSAPERISNIVQYIINHFDQKTKRNEYYKIGDKRLAGFNSIFATASIDIAKKYYLEFKKQLAEQPSDKKLKVAIIFSFAVNEDEEEIAQGLIQEENLESSENLDYSSRDFLDSAIKDYNAMFNVNFDTSSEKFQNYYKDVSQRVKDRELDLLIVVNMFLTGFDATTLNTLWIDKNLRMHGLLQAFSRTNRILNTIKTFGNIVCFRNLERQTNESISLFGNKEARGIVLLKTFDEYYNGYLSDGKNIKGYVELIEQLQDLYPVDKMIVGEENKKEFIKLYNAILKIKNILTTFDEFEGKEILSPRDFQDYHSKYIDIYNEFRRGKKGEAENINDDLIFEMELIKQVEINIDYILELVEKYQQSNMTDKEIVVNITKAIDSSIELRNKKQLIEDFIARLSKGDNIHEVWDEYVDIRREQELLDLIREESLQPENTLMLMENAFRDGVLQITGTTITDIMPPISRFNKQIDRAQIIDNVIDKLSSFFNRFFGI